MAKRKWTKEEANNYVRRATKYGLKYWSAADYLKKYHGIVVSPPASEKKSSFNFV